MKKYIVTLVLTTFQVAIVAQTVNVHFKNGQTIEYSSDNIDYVDFSPKASEPTLTPGQVVDLGLSVYWASCNLGAESPEEFGYYYAWGETSPKSNYTESTYSFYNQSTNRYISIGEDIAGTEYDAATVNLGSSWKMPTEGQMKELLEKCTWEWMQISGINGYKVIGTNGNSIFLPAAGYGGSNSSVNENKTIMYWTSSVQSDQQAIQLTNIGSYDHCIIAGNTKKWGCTIRPVTTNLNAGNTHAGQ